MNYFRTLLLGYSMRFRDTNHPPNNINAFRTIFLTQIIAEKRVYIQERKRFSLKTGYGIINKNKCDDKADI